MCTVYLTALIHALSLLSGSPRDQSELYKYVSPRGHPLSGLGACIVQQASRQSLHSNYFWLHASCLMLHNELYYFIKWKHSTISSGMKPDFGDWWSMRSIHITAGWTGIMDLGPKPSFVANSPVNKLGQGSRGKPQSILGEMINCCPIACIGKYGVCVYLVTRIHKYIMQT